jgi:hypothetical protein
MGAAMGNFMGGSAYAMANQIGEGYILVTERTFARLQPFELDKLAFELERMLRDVRGQQPDLADTQALQQRNRKLSRLQSCLSMVQSYKMRRR